ncbi:MAG: phenylalanine--tRNA ligase subunit beta [Anaerolineales bacterium]|nr:phenylalanine--tRNA ligase subunit beta [Anaerolineales bacterium]
MKVPISWLKEFVDIDVPIPELAYQMTLAGLEVEQIHYVGLPMSGTLAQMGASGHARKADAKISGFEWDREKIVVAEVSEVMPHPNADRLVLCKLNDGQQEHIVLTGAPNLFAFKGKGPLPKPLKVAYAMEGAQIYDGHAEGAQLVTLKRAKIRGVESYSMACSEKELGISDEHEGIILFDDDAPLGAALADYIGDAVLEVSILPSFARCASMLGVAREVAAILGKPLRTPEVSVTAEGEPFEAVIEITRPELNPRFVLGLVRGITLRPSPYRVQLRLKLAGMRPINNVVDATNYAMLESGQPLHAFDYDVLAGRAGGTAGKLKIITRTARAGEKLTTLDDVERILDEKTVLVCDAAGALSIAGVMGGLESEISEKTTNILLEGAAWNFINIRKTAQAQNLPSEASYRFSRGVHPAMAERGVYLGLELMRRWAGGVVARGLIDNYPLPPVDPTVEVTPADVKRWLGIELSAAQIAEALVRLEFKVALDGETVRATTPDHRLDIGPGITGVADLVEEVARIYGYDNLPETRMADELPLQVGNPLLDKEERLRDLLVYLGLQEVKNYRLTTPEREARRLRPDTPADDKPYLRLTNPISSDKAVMRHSVLASVLENAEWNARFRARLALFEIGPIFLGSEDPGGLPDEFQRLAIVLCGPRSLPSWQPADTAAMDFYDLKGILDGLFDGLHLPAVRHEPVAHPGFHPGKCARVLAGERQIGVFGELHPLVREGYDWPVAAAGTPILAADLDLDALLEQMPSLYATAPVPEYPPVLEDLALVVNEDLPGERVAELIRQTGGRVVAEVRLFDVYRGEKVGKGRKSLAYSITYQAPDKTLTDRDVAGIRTRILRRLEQELGAVLRS